MENLKKYVPDSIFKSIKSKKKEFTLEQVKKNYLDEISKRGGGISFIQSYASENKITEADDIDFISKNIKLSDIYYLISNFFTCSKNHYVKACNGSDTENVKEIISNLYSDYGKPIWEKHLPENPIIWNVTKEIKPNHFYITYLHSNPQSTFFDPILHDKITYNTTGIINLRIHLDHSIFIEIYSSL